MVNVTIERVEIEDCFYLKFDNSAKYQPGWILGEQYVEISTEDKKTSGYVPLSILEEYSTLEPVTPLKPSDNG